MKKIILAPIFACFMAGLINAQGILITDDGTTVPDASAILELKSTSQGFLPPRLTKAQIQTIASPVFGLIVYNTDDQKPVFFNGSDWYFFDNIPVVFSKKKSSVKITGNGDDPVAEKKEEKE